MLGEVVNDIGCGDGNVEGKDEGNCVGIILGENVVLSFMDKQLLIDARSKVTM